MVGLYPSPPENALVLCVNKKSQCRVIERTQPILPMGTGYVEGVTHEYDRHGTITLFAALNVLDGAVLAAYLSTRIQLWSLSRPSGAISERAVTSPLSARKR